MKTERYINAKEAGKYLDILPSVVLEMAKGQSIPFYIMPFRRPMVRFKLSEILEWKKYIHYVILPIIIISFLFKVLCIIH